MHRFLTVQKWIRSTLKHIFFRYYILLSQVTYTYLFKSGGLSYYSSHRCCSVVQREKILSPDPHTQVIIFYPEAGDLYTYLSCSNTYVNNSEKKSIYLYKKPQLEYLLIDPQ